MQAQLTKLAALVDGHLVGEDKVVNRVDTLKNADSGAISFLSNYKYKKYLAETHASAVILDSSVLESCPVASIVVENPYLAYAKISTYLNREPEFEPGIHPSAIIDSSADISSTAWVGPGAVIENNAVIGSGCSIGPGCVVQHHARVGSNTRLLANVVVCHHVEIGQECILHPGVVIGSDGFGIANDNGVWVKVPQLGTVLVGDNVEIGANSTIDRGALENTVLENGVKLDNQIQIAHNVSIGAHTAIAGCTGIAGSTKVGAYCAIGGGVGITGHVEVTDHVQLTGMSMVTRNILKPGTYSSGMSALPNSDWNKLHARYRKLNEMYNKIRDLEKQVKELTGSSE